MCAVILLGFFTVFTDDDTTQATNVVAQLLTAQGRLHLVGVALMPLHLQPSTSTLKL
jgi:hypothetical protein